MMRALYSGVAGLKTHQTRMDVIGNNIANVNTVAYKSMSMTFTELMYQTTQSASGPNAETGTAGKNAKQIGLGSTTGAISTKITTQGSTQTTGNPFDLKIAGDSFFVVSNGGDTGSKFFTRDGSFYVDAVGNLAMCANGYNVMGWKVDETTGDIKQDTVSALKIMDANNLTYEPEATSKAYVSGILDKNDSNVKSNSGRSMSLGFYDSLGYQYTAKISIHATTDEATYYVQLDDIVNSEGKSLKEIYGDCELSQIVNLGGMESKQTVAVNEAYAGKDEFSIKKLDSFLKPNATTLTDKKKLEENLPKLEVAVKDYLDGKTLSTDQVNLLDATYNDTTTTPNVDWKAILDKYKTDYGDAYKKGYVEYSVSSSSSSIGEIAISIGEVASAPSFTTHQLSGLWAMATAKDSATAGTLVASYFKAGIEGCKKADLDADMTKLKDAGLITTDTDYQMYAKAKLKELYPNVDFDNVLEGKIDTEGNFVVTSKNINGGLLKYDPDTGAFKNIQTNAGGQKTAELVFKENVTVNGKQISLNNFKNITIDFSPSTMYNNGGTSTVGLTKGDTDGAGAGRMLGKMEGVSIQTDGKIYASYTNGCTKLLGQIAVAKFANAAGLEKAGDNLYRSTLNSGDFDGIGADISADGGSMTSGTLEMSNVDLANEFTEMITTQRGYQANSRIITVSDTLLEELVNLKR